jgi:cell division protein FtsN
MTDQSVESGLELVLDNKKLIIVFLVLIALLGGAFVLGFIEGKRQGYREGTQAAAALEANSGAESAALSETPANGPDSNASAKSGESQDQPLNWYKSVNKPEEQAAIEPPPAKKTETPSAKAAPDEPISYSVQVGAFRQKHEAEAKAKVLKSKGFDSRIESPQAPEQLFLLKVGKFSSRADAIAMQLRLKNSGFKCFIKTN